MRFIFLLFTILMGALFLSSIPSAIEEMLNHGMLIAVIFLAPSAILFIGGILATKRSFARRKQRQNKKLPATDR